MADEEQVEQVKTEESTPSVEVKQPEIDQAEVKKQVDEIMKEIDLEDKEKEAKLRAEFAAQINKVKEDAMALSVKQTEEFKKSLGEYENKFKEINDKLEEYSGKKGLVDQPKDNPYTDSEKKEEVKVEDKPVDYRDVATKISGSTEDKEIAEKFIDSLSKR